MVEGRATGDGRFVEPGALRWEPAFMPYPLTWNRHGGGHDDRVVVGSIESIERDGEFIRGSGVLLTGIVPEAEQVIPIIEKKLVGLSVELDDETSVLQPIDVDGNPVGEPEPDLGIMLIGADAPVAPGEPTPEDEPPDTGGCAPGQHRDPATGGCVPDEEPPEVEAVDMQYRVTSARIRNAAIVDTPAFIECTIELEGEVAPESPAVTAALAAAAAFAQNHSGAMIAALPDADTASRLAVEGGLAPDELHATLAFYGPADEMTSAQVGTMKAAAERIAGAHKAFGPTISGYGVIGNDTPPASVVFIEAPVLNELRSAIETEAGVDPDGTHPHFTPHVTLGYGLDEAVLAERRGLEGLTFDRLLVALGDDRVEYPLGEPMNMPALVAGAVGPHQTGTSDAPWDAGANEAKLGSPMPLTRVRAVYAWYEDGAADADGLYPKSACKFIHHFVSDGGVPGSASTVACSAGIGVLHGGRGGTTIPSGDVGGVYNHLAGHLRSAGMEPPELSAVLSGTYCEACRTGNCDVVRTYTVPEDVAAEARRFQGWHRAGRTGGTAAAASRAATLARSGMLTYGQLRRLYLSQARLEPHAADVGWESGDPGYPSPGRVAWAAGGGQPGWEWAKRIVEELEGPVLTYAALTAAGVKAPPAAWFRDPELQGPTPWTVTDEGRVFGHLATWDTCHMSVAGVCRTPPHSSGGYAHFHTGGPFRLDDGSIIRAGKVTFGVNHADKELSSGPAVEHYEHTGHVAADVVAGEDRYGIWIAGALRPSLTEAERLTVQRSAISGDWRAPHGRLELMAALLVNHPGFPVVETMVASGRPRTLILAGIVEADLASRRRDRSRHDPRLDAAAEAIAETIGRDRRSLVAAMSAEVHR